MQHTSVFCRLLKALFPIAVIIGIAVTAPANAAEYTKHMKLSVQGEALTLLLKPNHVTRNLDVVGLDGRLQRTPVQSYTGKIEGDTNSWVRLTKSSNAIDGIISRYGKRFRLQQFGNRPARVEPLADNHDQRITLGTNKTALSAGATQTAPQVARIAKIAIVVDSKFNDRHNGKGLEYAMGLINSVDGIFREEFGLALQVQTAVNVTEAAADPFKYGSVTIETMLRAFRSYRMTSSLIGNDVSLVHLFTGNKPTDQPVGLAWIDTACRTDGYDVGVSTPYKHDILLLAHEIAHNFGALHDSDTSCATNDDKVMWPFISSATTQHFSSCTIATVKRSLANSCHAVVADPELASSALNNSSLVAGNNDHNPVRDPAAAYPTPVLATDLPESRSVISHQRLR